MKKFSLLFMMFLGIGMTSHAEGLEDLVFEDDIVQISTAVDLTNFALAVNDGNTELNAVLKDDIDYAEFTKIGDTGDHKYAGTFDGNFHTITFNCTAGSASWGLFGGVSGTIKNLKVDGSITTGINKIGGIVGECFGGTIENCISSVDIIGTANLDACYAGICARSSASGVKINNCLYEGTIDAPEAYCLASILGWAGDGCGAAISNCIFTGVINADDVTGSNPSYTISRRPDLVAVSNCYYVNDWATPNDGCEQVTEDQVASGELCYMMNGDQTTITWWQTLGTDATPVPFSNSLQVYAAGNLDCTGHSADGSELTYSNTKTQDIPDHQYEDGICIICGKVDPSMASLVDGFYQIETADQFVWFANLVNQGNNTANAKLMDDIELSSSYFTVIATSGNHYKGIFDGNYKTLTVDLIAESSSWGLFRYLDGTIQNLYLTGSLYTEWNKVGPLVGEIFSGKVLNVVCDVNVTSGYAGDGAISGLVGRGSGDGSLIENCIFAGNITGINYNSAAFIGWSGSTSILTNCAFTGSIEVDASQGNPYTFARNPGNVTCTNCYFVNEFGSHQDNTIQITAEDVKNGKLCYLLNGDQSQIVWNQTLDEEEIPFPFPNHERVYNAGEIYGNAYDAASYADFAQRVLDTERELFLDILAQKSLVENYLSELDALENCSNIDEFMAAWNGLLELRGSVVSCSEAYAAYKQKVEETDLYLQEHDDFYGKKREELEDYLRTREEPGSTYPRGTALYILEECELSEEEIRAETKRIDAMLEAAITEQPQAGTDMTMLVTNPTFKDGFNGWEGQVGTGHSGAEGSEMHAAECWNATMDMTQTLTGLANGIYEVQINGVFRPYPGDADLYNTNYAAMLTANGVTNYFQAPIEDAIPSNEAVDGFNCNLTGEYPDFEVIDFNGEDGYVPRGLVGYCRAFEAGRYQNAILANVTDGTLTIGIKVLGSGFENDALGFGNVKLFYHGELDQAGAGLDNVLESQAARAYTMLNNYEYSLDESAVYPNFSNEIKTKLQNAIDAVATTTDNEAKLALVTTFSDLFQETYVCKQGYKNLMREYDKLNELMDELAAFFTDEEMNEINPLMEQLLAYYEGEATTEEAQKDHLQTLSFMPKKVDGVYQLSTPVELMLFGSLVNAGETDADAILTADIDASEASMTMISTADNMYAGTFDGQGHTITYTMYADQERVGLFRALTGTIKNLSVAGTIYTSNKMAGGIVAEIFGGTIQNCVSSVNIESSFVGDAAYGGIAFRGSATGCTVKDCLYTGTINAPDAYNIAGILGFTGGDCSSTVSNCLFMGTINASPQGSDYPSYTISRNPSVSTVVNCYYMNGFGTPNEGSTEVTVEQIASGEVAFLLNGDQKDIQWTQNLPGDSYPVPFQTRGIVYANGSLMCDGKTPVEGTTVTYSNTEGSTVEDHHFENGFCTECGTPDLTFAALVDGFWQIGTAEQLVWFAKKVNFGDTKDNAELTADIDLSEVMDEFPMIGTTSKKFEGVFDGRYHTVNINKVNEAEGFGLFRALSGTVRKLRTSGTINTSAKRVGGIVCEIYGGTIENCESAVEIVSTFSGDALTGGIVARGSGDGSVINNCLFSGSLKSETAWNCIPIVGWCGNVTYITNTLSVGKLEVTLYASGTPYSLARNPEKAKCTNCYFLTQMGDVNEGSEQVTEEQLANGEVCALLNAGQEEVQWSQSEAFPIPFAGPDYEDAIMTIDNAIYKQGSTIVNLAGQRVSKVQKGRIYIVNGKKVLY
jgi:hypothetical protein